jgi:hypothetical protein
MFFEYLSPAIAAASRDAESFAYIFHIPAMIPESKCAFLEIFAGPLVDNGVYSMVKSVLNNGCIRPLRLMRDFSMISFLVTRATKIIQLCVCSRAAFLVRGDVCIDCSIIWANAPKRVALACEVI